MWVTEGSETVTGHRSMQPSKPSLNASFVEGSWLRSQLPRRWDLPVPYCHLGVIFHSPHSQAIAGSLTGRIVECNSSGHKGMN